MTFVLSISLMPSLALALDSAESKNTAEIEAEETTTQSVEEKVEQSNVADSDSIALSTQSASDGLTNPTSARIGQVLTGSVYRGASGETYHVYRIDIPEAGNYKFSYSNLHRVNSGTDIMFKLYDSYYQQFDWERIGSSTTEPHSDVFYLEPGQLYITVEADDYNRVKADFSCSLKQSGWWTRNQKTYYYSDDGSLAKGWRAIDDEKYYFLQSDGSAVKGFAKVGGKYYYFDKQTGAMQKGWRVVNGKKYYFLNSTGAAVTGLAKIGGTYYYFSPSGGHLLSGWKVINGKKYYFSSKTGAAAKGLVKIGNSRYYFGSQGYMLAGWKQINGKKYYFSSKTGAAAKGFVKVGNYRYYFDTSTNAVVTGWKKISGKYYYFYSGGSMATNTWIGKYHVNANGVRDRAR